jgi:hypothetical protein
MSPKRQKKLLDGFCSIISIGGLNGSNAIKVVVVVMMMMMNIRFTIHQHILRCLLIILFIYSLSLQFPPLQLVHIRLCYLHLVAFSCRN